MCDVAQKGTVVSHATVVSFIASVASSSTGRTSLLLPCALPSVSLVVCTV